VSGRPYDWQPLAEADPLPGDPDAIYDHAMYLRKAAAEMQQQVDVLHKMVANEGCLAGDYATGLQIKATDVAKKLDPVAARYSTVSGCLFGWQSELADFQASTLKVLARAQDAAARRARDPNAPPLPPNFRYEFFDMLGTDQTQALDPATEDLLAARKELATILAAAADRDRYWGNKISDAIDDKLADGFWDHIHSFVEHHAEQLEQLTNQLGLLTSGLGLAAIWFPPLLLPTLLLAGGIAATHTLMAAEGEGSWFDVGLDVAAMASFGAGKALSKGFEGILDATRGAAARAAEREAVEGVQLETAATREAAERVLADPTSSELEQQSASLDLARVDRQVERAGKEAVRGVLEAPKAAATRVQAFFHGAEDDAQLSNTAKRLASEHAGDPAVEYAARNLRKMTWAGRANFTTAATLDVGDKVTNSLSGSYRGFKARSKIAVGWLE
jgi:hypothetical protein